jgi:hypothetical protein
MGLDPPQPDWTLTLVDMTLQSVHGMAIANAATLIVELGFLSRFANQRRQMAHLGPAASEHLRQAHVGTPQKRPRDGVERAASWEPVRFDEKRK